jgi:hypothetical protein
LNKLLDSALSGTEVALTSKLFVSRSDSSAGTEDQALSLNKFDEDRDHDREGVSRDGHIGETVRLRGQ